MYDQDDQQQGKAKPNFAPNFADIIPVAFDEVDAAIFEHLQPLANGAFETERVQDTPARVRYIITNRELGHLGEVGARKLREQLTELLVTSPNSLGVKKSASHAERKAGLQRRKEFRDEILAGFYQRFFEEQEWLDEAEKDLIPKSGIASIRGVKLDEDAEVGGLNSSDHYAYPNPVKRRQIVAHFNKDKAAGRVQNKEAWVQSIYGIGRKTLKSYQDQFPEET